MISRLSGTIADKTPPHVIVDCAGVGYEVGVPMSTFYNLPAVGDTVTLLTVHVVREDAQLLFGFATESERHAFKELTKVSGIGPRTALAVLSGMSVTDLAQAITMQDTARVTTVPGIGKKTAERLLLELKGKLGADLGALGSTSAPDGQGDIIRALSALGYSDKEALIAMKSVPAGTGVSDGIRLALKALSK
jgi:holliday junction DNA helicase RuvA